MEMNISEKSLVCIDYPGIVLNPKKALETLDGMQNLKKTLSDHTKRIPLTFRPGDAYSKPAYGDPNNSTSLLIKIRRRKINNQSQFNNEENNKIKDKNDGSNNVNNENTSQTSGELIGEILGVVDRTVVFKSLCDYQYLPMERQSFKPSAPNYQPTNLPSFSHPPKTFPHPQKKSASTNLKTPEETIFNHLNAPQPHQNTTNFSTTTIFQPSTEIFVSQSSPLNPNNLPTNTSASYKSLHNQLFWQEMHSQENSPNCTHTTADDILTSTITPTTTTTISKPTLTTTTINQTPLSNPNLNNNDASHPLFLIPIFFSRFDQPFLYCFRDAQNNKKFSFPDNCVGISRSRRPHHTTVVKFSSDNLHLTPSAQTIDKISKAKLPQWKIEKVKTAFSQKKVWTSPALYAEVGPDVTKSNLKLILPALAYYYVDGPWRAMWVCYGYDCKKEKESKMYQNLDFRLERGRMSLYTGVKSKRKGFNNKVQSRSTTNFDDFEEDEDDDEDGGDDDDDGDGVGAVDEKIRKFKKEMEPSYIFKPGVLPLHKQTFYHLCHICEPEVQRLVHLNDGQESFCTERDGWCLPDTIDKCRAIINSYRRTVVRNHLRASDNILTQGGGDDEEDDDEEDDALYADGNDTSYGYVGGDEDNDGSGDNEDDVVGGGGGAGSGRGGSGRGGSGRGGSGGGNVSAFRTKYNSTRKPTKNKDDDDDDYIP